MADEPATKPTDPAADLPVLSDRIGRIVERSSKVWAEALDKQIDDIGHLKPDPLNTVPSMARWAYDFWDHPDRMATAMGQLWAAQADLWTRTMQRAWTGEAASPLIQPERGDKRFKDKLWDESPFYDYLKQSYLLTADWLKGRLAEAEGLTPQDRKKLELITRNFIEATSPSNSPVINPEVLRTTIDEKGENLIRGLEHLVRDLERGKGQLLIQQTDMSAFKVGENMATTPGAVVFENELLQLIQYAPATEQVHKTPLLFCPPWINKFYILDLNEKKSMIRWLVEQGHTVFVISWVNPGPAQKDETWESYMTKGVLTALAKVLEETGEPQANIVGYCIGGTMVGSTLAYMAANGDDRVKSATFFTAQLDFTDAGELQAFVDDEVLDTIEQAVDEKGYLAAENMFAAFNSLRSTDLIWGFVINNYLLGKENFPFDLLYWNSDSTAMPGRVHMYYLDTFYNRNLLAKGEMEIAGQRLDLSRVKLPCFHVGTVEDHIAPAPSTYRAAKMLGSRSQTYILAGSGHIAGVVNPPASGKYQYWTKRGLKGTTLEEWREGTTETKGSWWPHWDKWLAAKSDGKVPGRSPGTVLGQIEPAPGRYVKQRFDDES
ncbi:class I poly(R)-hydroxyalkanoic acid synthase [Paralimibaculum aggregatum]|uniref:Class I poly(R)-hydroxyalkanoic acid synthase n=1 Tax=Paralimibaculum aggregatum TaxID=3036245 RepID=A0ABQ6LK93_9RHOB|nr:class I poly(R)-hydroxyalkanoic acid synthase [Limibaculum sp. NKW23]GMG80826.1 class I poly(R)-hydroxyalkanoic acid synthase [Limibaculum sp. NKW23]